MKTNYHVTIGYKAVATFEIKAETPEEAKNIALDKVDKKGIYEGSVDYETVKVAGVLNMDESWNMV